MIGGPFGHPIFWARDAEAKEAKSSKQAFMLDRVADQFKTV